MPNNNDKFITISEFSTFLKTCIEESTDLTKEEKVRALAHLHSLDNAVGNDFYTIAMNENLPETKKAYHIYLYKEKEQWQYYITHTHMPGSSEPFKITKGSFSSADSTLLNKKKNNRGEYILDDEAKEKILNSFAPFTHSPNFEDFYTLYRREYKYPSKCNDNNDFLIDLHLSRLLFHLHVQFLMIRKLKGILEICSGDEKIGSSITKILTSFQEKNYQSSKIKEIYALAKDLSDEKAKLLCKTIDELKEYQHKDFMSAYQAIFDLLNDLCKTATEKLPKLEKILAETSYQKEIISLCNTRMEFASGCSEIYKKNAKWGTFLPFSQIDDPTILDQSEFRGVCYGHAFNWAKKVSLGAQKTDIFATKNVIAGQRTNFMADIKSSTSSGIVYIIPENEPPHFANIIVNLIKNIDSSKIYNLALTFTSGPPHALGLRKTKQGKKDQFEFLDSNYGIYNIESASALLYFLIDHFSLYHKPDCKIDLIGCIALPFANNLSVCSSFVGGNTYLFDQRVIWPLQILPSQKYLFTLFDTNESSAQSSMQSAGQDIPDLQEDELRQTISCEEKLFDVKWKLNWKRKH